MTKPSKTSSHFMPHVCYMSSAANMIIHYLIFIIVLPNIDFKICFSVTFIFMICYQLDVPHLSSYNIVDLTTVLYNLLSLCVWCYASIAHSLSSSISSIIFSSYESCSHLLLRSSDDKPKYLNWLHFGTNTPSNWTSPPFISHELNS